MKNYGKYGKCTGRVEFNAARAEIEKLREQGYSLRRIFEHLAQHGRFSQTYVTFTRFVNGKPRKKACRRQNDTPIVECPVSAADHEQKLATPSLVPTDKNHIEKASSGFEHFIYNPASIDKDSLI